MIKKIFLLIFLSLNFAFVNAQLNIEWQKCYGGTKGDALEEVLQTSDGGFIFSVWTDSNDGDFTENLGGKDICLIKLDRFGKKQWQKSYGGSKDDYLKSLIQTTDGGYIFSANNGTVLGNTNNENAWIVRINSSGSILWQKFFNECNEMIETSDKGFIVSVLIDTVVVQNNGTSSFKIKKIRKINQQGEIEWQKNIEGSKIVKTTDGNYFIYTESNWSKDADIRYWKINQQGDILWEKKIGGSGTDFARDVQQTADGGCVITGVTFSNDGDVIGNHGNGDIWMVKVNASGNIEWQRCIGGSGIDENELSVLTTNDGGYLITTVAYSVDGDFSGHYGNKNGDIWVAKLNKFGEIIWKKCIGGSGEDNQNTIISTKDGSYIICGSTNSIDGDVTGFKGGESDIWLVKINAIGNIEWQRCFGGSKMDLSEHVSVFFKTSEDDFFIINNTMSNDFDVSGNHGDFDIWVVKLTTKSITNSLTELDNSVGKTTIYPNPVNNKFSIQFNEPIFKITLMDMLGNLVYTNDSGNKEYLIPENLQSGSYIIEIDTPLGVMHENLLINKN